jgi:tRNA (cytidine/uridine-2'-O-)-methyltransferase
LAPLTQERKCAIATNARELPAHHAAFAPRASGVAGIDSVMRIALYEPDIPQNTGTILRLAACLDVEAHIIEPAGFPTSDRAFRRAGMDYLDQVTIMRHASWDAFGHWRRTSGARLILFTTRGHVSYLDHAYRADDILLFGRESSGVPQDVRQAADAQLVIPMRAGTRSLNVALAAALAVGEALRQTGGFSGLPAAQPP